MTHQVREPEFSAIGYRNLLASAQERGYRVVRMCDALDARSPALILRHDVDFSVECAGAMARLEHSLGIRSTYFFMVTSDYYNLLAPYSRSEVREIAGMGHEIGLHWDSEFLPAAPEERVRLLRSQLDILQNVAGHEILSASQHIPTDTPAFDISPHVRFNAYSATFARFQYVSDSSMVWREQTPIDLMERRTDIQFLAHPLWWMSPGAAQDEKIASAIETTAARIERTSKEFVSYMRKVLASRREYDEKCRKVLNGE